MKKTPLEGIPAGIPPSILVETRGGIWYDSSSSEAARVYFIDLDEGLYLKRSGEGKLGEEARLCRIFHRIGLGAEVVDFLSADGEDWMLTRRLPGEDATHRLDDPVRLCDLLGEAFRSLHEEGLEKYRALGPDPAGLPDRSAETLTGAKRGREAGVWNARMRPELFGVSGREEAARILDGAEALLRPECLIHGDACLPNVLFDGPRFSGFIDCGGAGFGSRHSDLFWTVWSLSFNLGEDRWKDRFLDAYGRDRVDGETLCAAACEVFLA